MDVDPRGSEDHFEPVMIQEQALTDIGVKAPPDPWSGWARLADPPAPPNDAAAPVEPEELSWLADCQRTPASVPLHLAGLGLFRQSGL